MADSSTNPSTKAVQRTGGPSLADLAPAGIDGRVWVKTIKQQLMASKNGEPTDAELVYFMTVANRSGLDPAKREIYAIFRNAWQKDGTYKPVMSVQTGIDGLRVVAERTGKYAGSKEPEFIYDPDLKISVNRAGEQRTVPNKARVTVIKLMQGKLIETARTARWDEYYPGDQMGGQWRMRPEQMLSKVAEAQALRAAFPNDTAGLYIDEEMQQADIVEDGVDLTDLKEKIEKANEDDLMEILGNQTPEIQKQITPWVDARFKALNEVKEKTDGGNEIGRPKISQK